MRTAWPLKRRLETFNQNPLLTTCNAYATAYNRHQFPTPSRGKWLAEKQTPSRRCEARQRFDQPGRVVSRRGGAFEEVPRTKKDLVATGVVSRRRS
jgi:hypothetical protein